MLHFFLCRFPSYMSIYYVIILSDSLSSGYKRQKCRSKETWFSRLLYKIDIFFSSEYSSYWCASILWIFCHQSAHKATKGRNVKIWYIYMIKVWFFYVKIHLIDAHPFYEYLWTSILWKCRNVKIETWFSRLQIKIVIIFSVYIPLIYKLFKKNILSVSLSVRLQKAVM